MDKVQKEQQSLKQYIEAIMVITYNGSVTLQKKKKVAIPVTLNT